MLWSTPMSQKDINSAGKYAALLSMTEVGLGSLLHAYRVPFAGHFLSLNQALICELSVHEAEDKKAVTPFRIAMVAAALKSLSPMGKRLTPMLAISVQGFLFSVGQWLFGSGYLGNLFSFWLLSLWAFLQPLLLYLFIFGYSIIEVGQYFLRDISKIIPITLEHIAMAVAGLVLIKLLIAAVIHHLVYYATEAQIDSYLERLKRPFKGISLEAKEAQNKAISGREKAKIVFKDMRQPWFVLSMLLMASFFFVTEPNVVNFIWYILRPIACGIIVFYALRFLPIYEWLRRHLFNGEGPVAKTLDQAMAYIKSENLK